jgi:hypothetical protein
VIVRAPRPEAGYLQISNDVLRDDRLHLRSLGLLVRILSRPDNWETSAERLAKECHEGRDALATALRELRDTGYMRQEKWQDRETGRWTTVTYVYDQPTAAPAQQPALLAGGQPSPLATPDTASQGSGNQGSGNQGSDSQGLLRRTDKEDQLQGEFLPGTEVEPAAAAGAPAPAAGELTPPSRIDVQRVCNHLAVNVRANGAKATVTKQWHTEARRLLDLDSRAEAEVHRVIDWATADSFWSSNVLSVPTLRKQYDKLRIRMLRDAEHQQPAAVSREAYAATFTEGPAPEPDWED